MVLQMRFYEETMLDYANDDTSPLFPIHWEHNGSVYPFEDWWDFGGQILDLWMVQVQQLVVGPRTSARLGFDMGPYSLWVRREQGRVEAWSGDPEVAWTTTMDELCRSLCEAASTIRDKFASLEIRPGEQEALRFGIRGLERARSRFPD